MIEKKHSDPKAFTPLENDGWQPVSRFERNFNFARFKYRIFGVEYFKNDAAFQNALEQVRMWKAIKSR